jgi:hypothetical protein
LNFERSHPRPVSFWGALCVGFAVSVVFSSVLPACTTSEAVDFDALPSGAAGSTGGGSVGGNGSMTGAAGTTTGAAGTTTGAAGTTTGAAGSTSGHGGSGGHGVAGSTGSSGAGTTGSTGAAGARVDAGASGGASGTSDAGTVTDSGYPLTFTAYILPMLNNACGGCHFDGGSQAPKGGFGYTNYAKLVGPVSSATMGCTSLDASKRRVVPGHPENSLIFIKVSVQNPPSGCGGHMPYMGTNMSAENQASLKAWILAGAPQ